MGELVGECSGVGFGRLESIEARYLDKVADGRVVRLAAAGANVGARVGEESVGMLDELEGCRRPPRSVPASKPCWRSCLWVSPNQTIDVPKTLPN